MPQRDCYSPNFLLFVSVFISLFLITSAAVACPSISQGDIVGSVKSGFQRDEISGIAISRTQKYNNSDIVYLHNDGSKDSIAAYEVDTGKFIQKFTISSI